MTRAEYTGMSSEETVGERHSQKAGQRSTMNSCEGQGQVGKVNPGPGQVGKACARSYAWAASLASYVDGDLQGLRVRCTPSCSDPAHNPEPPPTPLRPSVPTPLPLAYPMPLMPMIASPRV